MNLLPCSEDAEKAICACFLMNPDWVGPYLAEKGMTSAKFYLPSAAILIEACLSMWADGKKVDFITLTDEIRRLGKLQDVGGAFAVTELANMLPSYANIGDYLETVETDWKRRQLVQFAKEASELSTAREEDPIAISSRLIEKVSGLSVASVSPVLSPQDLAFGVLGRCQEAMLNKGKPKDVIPTGFTEFDALLNGGMRRKSFILVTAPTKGGKTIFADNVVEHACVDLKHRSMVFSLEMSPEERADRMVSSIGRVGATAMAMGWLNERDMQGLQTAAVKLSAAPIIIRGDLFALSQIVGAVRQEKLRNPDLSLVVVDYLQLIDEPMGKSENREQVVARISTTLRRLASQLDVVVMFLAQENDDGRARESRRLEQDCTTWLQIENCKEDEAVKVAKVRLNRNGPPGVFKLTYRKNYLRFENHIPDPS